MKSKILRILFLVLALVLISSACFAEVSEAGDEDVASKSTVGNIVFAGMVIVFASLVLVALIIDLLKHLQKKDKRQSKTEKEFNLKKKIVSISQIRLRAPVLPLNQKMLTAVIMTIFLHENEVENHSKMLLTMKRAKISPWQQSSKLQMPNASFGNRPIIQRSTPIIKD